MTYSIRTLISVLAVGAVVLGCSPAASSSPSAAVPSPAAPSPIASGSPIASSGSVVLERTGPIGCDAMGVDYKTATINIDAASDPDVWAGTDTAKPGKIAVKWTEGFTATGDTDIVILGPKGEEVARDGTVINVPADAYPRLAGYFVCLAPDALYVLETDPQ